VTGQRVGSYEIVRVLARGGMAVVYLAHQPALDRDVALKQLDLDIQDVTIAQRFVREARLAAGLDHPNVVTLFDFFEHDGVPYIAMEYVSGGSLRPLVADLRLPQVFGVLEGMLNGLGHAEERSIAHRDLKPENVLVTGRGGVKIADFGIARAYDALTGHFTSTNAAIGTPAYMAPEQALSERLGPYTDIYAVGVMAYEMLAGRPPFGNGITPMAVLYAHVHQPPPPLADRAPETPASLRGWVDWLLAKAPEDRPASAAEAWEALEEIAVAELGPYWRRSAAVIPAPEQVTSAMTTEEPTTPLPSTRTVAPAPEPQRSRRPRRLALLAGGLSVLGAAAVAAFVLPESGRAPPPAEAAVPFDFDGDRRQEIVVGMPGSARLENGPPGGLVVIHRGDRRATPTVITPRDARLGAPYTADDGFGSSPQSGDFDRDGWADLAIGVPGRQLVSVLYGSADGLLKERPDTLTNRGLGEGAGRYGHRLAAGDFDRDGFADLAVGAPGEELTAPKSGAIELLFGSPDGLTTERARTIRRPDDTYVAFGRRLQTGHVNGDGNLDLVEGAPDGPEGQPGHISFCRGTARGPTRCQRLGDSGTSSVAVADVTGDGLEDIVQGDHVESPEPSLLPQGGGELRLWRGGRRRPAAEPKTITQELRAVPGEDEAGDMFGFAVDADDLNGDGYADMVVGVPGENEGAGAVMVIRGAPNGFTLTGNNGFTRGWAGIPGDEAAGENLGASLAIVRLPGDDRPDVVVTAGGAPHLDDAILVLRGGPGAFAPDELLSVSRLRLGEAVQAPQIDEIRIARGRPG
jgi:Protein kinase domain/FG-GAP-like repeat/FG-GAP repeat